MLLVTVSCRLQRLREPVFSEFPAGVAELADALDSKSSDRKIVWVRAPPPALSLLELARPQAAPSQTLLHLDPAID
jgi:hypothetical protein